MATQSKRVSPSADGSPNPDLTLTVELASARVPIADLQALRVGSVVPLSQTVNSSVRLLADGVAIAEAELVTIGSTSGIQIVRLL